LEKTTPKLELRDLHIVYRSQGGDEVEAVSGVNLEIADKPGVGEIVVFLGPSGCGKSTILKAVAGLLPPTQGQVLVDGVPVTGIGRDRGMVFQAYTSFGWLTVQENIEYGLKLQGMRKAERAAQAERYLEAVGLKDSKELSGGMKQRVAIARTLLNKPRLLLMDEPFGALDPQTRWGMQGLLIDISRKEDNTILFVTHDVSEAVYLADTVVVLSKRPAQIVGKIDVPLFTNRDLSLKSSAEFRDVEKRLLDLLYQKQ
jgi:NitT/TauT family transport system ATP-binding protein